MTMLMAAMAAAINLVYTAIVGSVTGGAGTGVSAGGQLAVNTAGTWQITRIGDTGTPSPSGVQTWATPTSGTVGNTHWVRATIITGTVTTGTTGSWLALSSNRTWTKTGTFEDEEVNLTIEIATDSGGANIVSSGSVSLGFVHA